MYKSTSFRPRINPIIQQIFAILILTECLLNGKNVFKMEPCTVFKTVKSEIMENNENSAIIW
jgi:fumarate reductase subunit C